MYSLSIVIPAKNEATGLRQLLPELASSYPDAEIILVNDGSTDDTAEVAAAAGVTVVFVKKALIGFAGPRVIEQTVNEKLPEGFQRAEFLLEHGVVDLILDRREMRARIANMLAIMTRQPAP